MVFQSSPRLFGRRRPLASSVLGLGLLSAVVLGNGASGCLAVGGVGSECVVNSDCSGCAPGTDCTEAALICASQQCHTVCNTSADCEDKDYPMCVRGQDEQPYCDERRSCSVMTGEATNDGEVEYCPAGQVCGDDHYCAPTCEAQADCAADRRCRNGVCVPEGSAPVAPGSAAAGDTCFTNSDCSTWLCLEGFCRGCAADIDCPSGRACNPAGAAGGRCEPSSCVDCSSAFALVLAGEPGEICPGSLEAFTGLDACACTPPGGQEVDVCGDLCGETLCNGAPPSSDCFDCLLQRCTSEMKVCAAY